MIVLIKLTLLMIDNIRQLQASFLALNLCISVVILSLTNIHIPLPACIPIYLKDSTTGISQSEREVSLGEFGRVVTGCNVLVYRMGSKSFNGVHDHHEGLRSVTQKQQHVMFYIIS